MPNMARKSSGTTGSSRGTPRNVPAIALDLLNIQYAQEQGDEMNEKILKQKLDAKLATMQSKIWEKNYNTIHAEYVKAFDALKTAEIGLAKMKQDKSLEIEDRKQKGLTTRDRMKYEDAEEARTDSEFYFARVYTNMRNAGIPEAQSMRFIGGLAKVTNEEEKVTILRELQGAYKRGELTSDQFMSMWEAANGIGTSGTSGTRKTGSRSSGGGLSVGERPKAVEYVLNVMTNASPVSAKEDRVRRPDKTEGAEASTEQMYDFAYQMTNAARNSGLTPEELSRGVLAELEKARSMLMETGDASSNPSTPGTVRLDRDENWEDREKLKRYQKMVNFFHSPAGKDFMRWMQESVTQGAFISPRWQAPTAATATQTSQSTATSDSDLPAKNDLPSLDEIPGAPPSSTSVYGAPTYKGDAAAPVTDQEMIDYSNQPGKGTTTEMQAQTAQKRTDAISRIMTVGTKYGLVPGRKVVYSPRGVGSNPQLRSGDTFIVVEYGIKGQEGFDSNGVELRRDMRTYNTDDMWDPNRKRYPQEFFVIPVTQFQNFREIKN